MPSSPPITFADLPGRRVGLWGLGTEGQATWRRLLTLGISPVMVDDDPAKLADLVGHGKVLTIGSGGLDALADCDVVIKSPGITRYCDEVKYLENAGIAVVGGVGLFVQQTDKARIIGVTGTKGKSTTAAIITHLLTGLGQLAYAVGNSGDVPYDPDFVEPEPQWWVLELSSFQVMDLWSAPRVVVVTSLSPDHLDWHDASKERYYADKLRLCTLPGAEVVIANKCDDLLVSHGAQLGELVHWVGMQELDDVSWAEPLGLVGNHNLTNAVLARAAIMACQVPGSEDDATIRRAAFGFTPLASRLELIGSAGGVDFVDDGLATNVLPTIAALEAYRDRSVALLVGGFDRGIEYEALAIALSSRSQPTLVLGLPDNGSRILGAIDRKLGSGRRSVQLEQTLGLVQAVNRAAGWARPDGVVLLSPAAPSFGRYLTFKERSLAFRQAAEKCEGFQVHRIKSS